MNYSYIYHQSHQSHQSSSFSDARTWILAALSGPVGPWRVRGYFCLNRSFRPCRWGFLNETWRFSGKTWENMEKHQLLCKVGMCSCHVWLLITGEYCFWSYGFGMIWIELWSHGVSRWMWSPNLTCGVVNFAAPFFGGGELSPAGGEVVILPPQKGSWLEACPGPLCSKHAGHGLGLAQFSLGPKCGSLLVDVY